MKKMFFYRLTMSAALWCAALISSVAVAQQLTVTEQLFDRAANGEKFAFGADLSGVPMMEGWTKWLDKNGVQKDILQIMKEQGINSVRLRVWTVASGGSSKQEVVNMCKRCKAMGFNVMIDFHYSDTWADPGNQTIPAAWTDHSVDALAKKVYDHTYDVLQAIKDVGVTPKWVQVGNETKRGMLYPVGQTNKGGSAAFAKFVQSGYNAVKAIDPSIQVIVHLDNGHDNSLYRSIFDGLKKNGAKWDIIGMSAYPRWSHLDGPTMIQKVMANIKDLKSRYGTPCMIVETGHFPDERAVEGNQYIVGVINEMLKNGDLGCFYWAPEMIGGNGMGAWDPQTMRPSVMMDAFLGLRHTAVSTYANTRLVTPIDTAANAPGSEVTLKVYAKTPTNITKVQKVDFYLNGFKKGMVQGDQSVNSYFSCGIPNLGAGSYLFFAKVHDTQNHVVVTDTISFLVGEVRKFQENADGFAGCENMENTFSKQSRPYTGEGYVPATSAAGGAVCWQAYFPAAGEYMFVVRYRTDVTKNVKFYIDDVSKYMLCSASLPGRWTYVCKKRTVNEPGMHSMKMEATEKGLPDIDFMAIASPEGTDLVSYIEEASEIRSLASRRTQEGQCIYDLSGRLVSVDGRTEGLRPGVYLRNGRKVYLMER